MCFLVSKQVYLRQNNCLVILFILIHVEYSNYSNIAISL